ncbi:MAG TPA: SagB/ThcOx family dehydrogenase [Actinomycetota bacterium]|nr:SagB/ThcOx family dehydrogenase [Actinomycetota bacterium]
MGILEYHEASKHSPESVRRSRRRLDWANKPAPYKDYEPGLAEYPLAWPPPPSGPGPVEGGFLKSGFLGRLLNLGAGVLRKRAVPGTETIEFRTYASAGGLYPVEIYAAVGGVAGLPPGLFHYHPRRRALVRLGEGDWRGTLAAATAGEPAVGEAPVVLALTGMPWRTAWKYGPRGFRHLYWDAGMILANLLAISSAAGVTARVVLGFDDGAVSDLLGLDGTREVPLAVLAVGAGAPAPPAGPVPPLRAAWAPLSGEEIDQPEILAAQASGGLAGDEVARWRAGGGRRAVAGREPGGEPGREPGGGRGISLERAIRRRGSARSFDRLPVPLGMLADILAAATGGIPTDLTPAGERRVVPYFIANRVELLDPGAYAYDGDLRMLDLGDFARAAGFLCLEQRLGRDAAATHFLMADLPAMLGALGDRGYRVAQLEAGIVGGRIYLAASRHGLGATGLTFYDDEVSEFLAHVGAPGLSPMLAVAVGPATRRLLPLA